MKQPGKGRFRKVQKGSNAGLTKRRQFVEFGDFGMKALERGRITANQLEACRVAINRSLGRKGEIHIRIFPHKPITKKPLETRMGKGKGSVDHYVALVAPGAVLIEVGSVAMEDAQKALRLAAAKLPISTKFVRRVERV